jgi:hypothetical protein
MLIHGSCHCGQITYEADVEPDAVRICHCTDCQQLSGTLFRAVIVVTREKFSLRSGEPKIYVKTTDSGNKRVQSFCDTCGSPIYSSAVSDPPSYSLRLGLIRERAQLQPQKQIWCRSALPWAMNLEGVEKVSQQ